MWIKNLSHLSKIDCSQSPLMVTFLTGAAISHSGQNVGILKCKVVNKGGTVIFHEKLEQRALEKNPSHLTSFVANAITKTCGFFISWILQRQLNFTRFWLWDTVNLPLPSTPCSCIESPHHKADLWAMGHTPSAGKYWMKLAIKRNAQTNIDIFGR